MFIIVSQKVVLSGLIVLKTILVQVTEVSFSVHKYKQTTILEQINHITLQCLYQTNACPKYTHSSCNNSKTHDIPALILYSLVFFASVT
jgi:hypothetical protein